MDNIDKDKIAANVNGIVMTFKIRAIIHALTDEQRAKYDRYISREFASIEKSLETLLSPEQLDSIRSEILS